MVTESTSQRLCRQKQDVRSHLSDDSGWQSLPVCEERLGWSCMATRLHKPPIVFLQKDWCKHLLGFSRENLKSKDYKSRRCKVPSPSLVSTDFNINWRIKVGFNCRDDVNFVQIQLCQICSPAISSSVDESSIKEGIGAMMLMLLR